MSSYIVDLKQVDLFLETMSNSCKVMNSYSNINSDYSASLSLLNCFVQNEKDTLSLSHHASQKLSLVSVVTTLEGNLIRFLPLVISALTLIANQISLFLLHQLSCYYDKFEYDDR